MKWNRVLKEEEKNMIEVNDKLAKKKKKDGFFNIRNRKIRSPHKEKCLELIFHTMKRKERNPLHLH